MAGKQISGALPPPLDLCGQIGFYAHTGLHSAGLFQITTHSVLQMPSAHMQSLFYLEINHWKGLLLQSTQVLGRNSEDPGHPSVSFDHVDSLKSV